MTKVSRIPVDPEHMGRFINNLWSSITLLESKEEVKEFLRDFLSHTETKMLAKRLQIAKMLVEKKSYQAIKSHVRVQNSTVAKINNILSTSKGGGLRKVAESLIELKGKEKEKEGREKLVKRRKKKKSAEKVLPYSFGTLH